MKIRWKRGPEDNETWYGSVDGHQRADVWQDPDGRWAVSVDCRYVGEASGPDDGKARAREALRASNPYRQIATDPEAVLDNGARFVPAATLADEYGGRVQIDVDDGAYVLAVRDSSTGRYRWSTHVFPEAHRVMCSLPEPNPAPAIKDRLLAYDFGSR